MSFFRSEAVALVRRWAETGAWAAMTALTALWLFYAAGLGEFWSWALAALALCGGGLLVRSAALSALGRAEGEAPGVVAIDERRIAYFGPEIGGVAAIDDIAAVEIRGPDPANRLFGTVWILHRPEEDPLAVPAAAQGAEGMIDALAALPGFPAARAVAALAQPQAGGATIWRRGASADRPALASARGAGLTR